MKDKKLICPICNNDSENNFKDYYYITDGSMNYPASMDESIIKYCKNCYFSFCFPNIDRSVLTYYYKDYYNGKFTSLNSLLYKINNNIPFIDPRSFAQINLINNYINFNKLKILDIGSGNCIFYIQLISLGFSNIEYHVIEPQIKNKMFYEKLNIKNHVISIEDKITEIPSNEYDLIIMSHSLEHFNSNSIETIFYNMLHLVKNEGLIFIEVPNADLSQYPHTNERMQPHLSFFSNKSFYFLAKKFNLDISYINNFGVDQNKNTKNFRTDRSFKLNENKKIQISQTYSLKKNKYKNMLTKNNFLLFIYSILSIFKILNIKKNKNFFNLNFRENQLCDKNGEFLRILLKKK